MQLRRQNVRMGQTARQIDQNLRCCCSCIFNDFEVRINVLRNGFESEKGVKAKRENRLEPARQVNLPELAGSTSKAHLAELAADIAVPPTC